ncbi:MAG: type II secretion system protein [Patescibacteria group bacterium]
MKNLKRGFTLIELLVVIAIIGILSSVVLASLNTARGKGANAAVKSNLNNIRAQAELVYDTAGGTYAAVCVDTNVAKGYNSAVTVGGGSGVCANTTLGWAASASLKVVEGSNGFWCVDYTGTSKAIVANLTSNTDISCD